jgi:glutathione S-transferase
MIAMGCSEDRKLVLYGGPNSPFARMARVVGLELGLDFEYSVIDVYSASFLDAFNPLRQIPTLLVNGCDAIYDSRVIMAEFAFRAGRPDFLHDRDSMKSTRVALSIGITETCLQHRMESIRPEGERSGAVLAKLAVKLERGLRHLEKMAGEISAGPLRLEQVVAACMLEYVDYRYSGDWRADCPGLRDWLLNFRERGSMVASRPYG